MALAMTCHDSCHTTFSLFPSVCSAILVALLFYTFIRRNHHKHITPTEMTRVYIIRGMNCPHCQASVAKAISGVKGVTAVDVNLSTGRATVEGAHNAADVIAAVRAAGFDAAE